MNDKEIFLIAVVLWVVCAAVSVIAAVASAI